MENKTRTIEDLTIEEAAGRLIERLSPIQQWVEADITEAAGLICAENIYAQTPVPAFSRSAMDGYAVRAAELTGASASAPAALTVCGHIYAGESASCTCEPGTAVRIMTGAMLPAGADCVIRQEDTNGGEDRVQIYTAGRTGQNICAAGEEIQAGALVIPAGQRMGRIEAALLAGMGRTRFRAVRPLRAAILSTGSELVSPGHPLQAGQICNSILPMLRLSIEGAHFTVPVARTLPDDTAQISAALSEAVQQADIVLTTGGVSVGKRDLLPQVLENLGAEILFRRARIQPGTPTMGSILEGTPILSLSGNPFAALANFDYYFWQMAAVLMGSDSLLPCVCQAVLLTPYMKQNQKRRFVRGYCENGTVRIPAEGHMASVVGNLRQCNCYVDVPAQTRLHAGDLVSVRMMMN